MDHGSPFRSTRDQGRGLRLSRTAAAAGGDCHKRDWAENPQIPARPQQLTEENIFKKKMKPRTWAEHDLEATAGRGLAEDGWMVAVEIASSSLHLSLAGSSVFFFPVFFSFFRFEIIYAPVPLDLLSPASNPNSDCEFASLCRVSRTGVSP